MNRFLLSSILLIMSCPFIYSQGDGLRIFEWKSFLPYKLGKSVTQSDNSIIYSTNQSLAIISKEDRSVRFMSKVEGLSDTGIDLVRYDHFNDQLVVIYSNSNIDLVDENVLNVPDIKNNNNIIGSKQINNVHIADSERIFFSTAFGIVEYRTASKEFGTTIFTNINIDDFSSSGNFLFAATEDGLYYINEEQNPNIGDFSQWKLLGVEEGLPLLYEAIDVETYDDKVFLTDGEKVWKSESGELNFQEIFIPEENYNVRFLSAGTNYLMIGQRRDRGSKMNYWQSDNTIIDGGDICIDRVLYSIEDEEGNIWFADEFRDFRHINGPQGDCFEATYDSPLTERVSEVTIFEDKVAVASGGVSDAYGDLFNRDGVFILIDDEWKILQENNSSFIRNNDLLSFFRVLFSQDGSKLLMGTFWRGIMVYDLESGEAELWDKENTALQGAIGDDRTRITDMEYDFQGNLWISNYNAPRPLVVMEPDGTWRSFTTLGRQRLGDMTIDELGNKWVVITGSSGGVIVYNEGNDLASTADDKKKFINLNNSEISSPQVFTVETDLEGDVWVGTAEGVVVFECGSDVFGEVCVGNRPTVLVDSIAAYLLETEEVKTIAFDGANRKWFGTRNGIFVQSADGETQVAKYDESNSPLFDNDVVDLAYDGRTGLMYIASNSGLQAIKTETTIGKSTHSGNVVAFPNPVPPDYNGPIAIKGLANNALVKITDVNGMLVHESEALGGQAIWDGNDLSGSRAPTGVYLVFSTGDNGFGEPDSFVTKILFIR